MKKKQSSVNKKDYSLEDLPKTRWEQFWRILRDNFALIIKLGLILLVLILPFLVAYVMKYINISYIEQSTSIEEADKLKNIAFINIIFGAIYVPCLMFFFIGLGGILKVLRRLMWDEPLFFKEDFFLGIKENVGQFIFFSFLIGLIVFLNIFAYNSTLGWMKYVSYALLGVSYGLVIPMVMVTVFISSIYNNKLSVSFSVGLRLFIRRGIFPILFLLVLYSVYFLGLIDMSIIIYLAILFVLIIILLPIWLLGFYMNFIKNSDDCINTYYYTDQAYLGLYQNKFKKDRTEQKK